MVCLGMLKLDQYLFEGQEDAIMCAGKTSLMGTTCSTKMSMQNYEISCYLIGSNMLPFLPGKGLEVFSYRNIFFSIPYLSDHGFQLAGRPFDPLGGRVGRPQLASRPLEQRVRGTASKYVY